MTRRSCRRLLGAAMIATASACNSTDPGYTCTANVVAGLLVSVQDARDSTPLLDSLTVRAVDGAYTEALVPWGNLLPDAKGVLVAQSRGGAFERPGNYTVTASRPGFAPQSATGLAVSRDACHVRTVAVTIRLSPGA